jgi:hypothetical protein
MLLKSTKDDEDLTLFIDKVSGLQFAGEGPFLFGEFLRTSFVGEVVTIPNTWTTVNSAVTVRYMLGNQEHILYAQTIDKIPMLFRLVNPHLLPYIVVHPDQYDQFMKW